MRETLWDWWNTSALSRLSPIGAVVLIHTRWHPEDLIGRALVEQAHEPWVRLRFAALCEEGEDDPLGRQPGEALWPEQYSAEWLARRRDGMPLYYWNALYQQRPTRHLAQEWPAEYFQRGDLWFAAWPREADGWLRAMALDPSKGRRETSDYSAYVLAAADDAGRLWVEADLARRAPGAIVADGVAHCRRFRPLALGVEGNAWQDLLGGMFARALADEAVEGVDTFTVDNRVDKDLRIRRLDPWLRTGRIFFRDTPGTRLLVQQLREFPLAEYRDGPDALEMAVRLLAQLQASDDGGDGERFERIRA